MRIGQSTGTRARLVEAARDLFWSRGYEATSLGDVVRASKVNPGSLYYFFRTKESLLLAVLDWYTTALYPVLIEPLLQPPADPIERVFALLGGYRRGLEESRCMRGCPIGNLALEVGDSQPRARSRIARNFAGWREWVQKFLDEAVTAGDLPSGTDTASLASFVLASMEGAVMQARAHRSLAPFDQVVAQLRNYFDLLRAPRTAGRKNEKRRTR